MKKFMVVAAAMLALDFTAAVAQPASKRPLSVTIQRPSSRDDAKREPVGVRHEVSGAVSDKSARVWLVVHPQETSDCWIQNPILANADGTWRLLAQFGENDPAHSGKPFEIRAFANPKSALRPGKTTCWPEAEAHSDPVYVIRK